ncbi:MAG: hypothetical protein HQL10_05610 [Nitrospirae bacterium]|uniref:Magnetosome protein Man1 n=1 Tax=uncultured Nitrospirota bacterium TaxID=170969 RepID=A0A142BTU4_9BACT|nr:magnetosome protein Man1 [uncultured Nitrospirota bacterium]MBF0328613.1 hypothetical protein [Nitrospirota bacterium]
MNENVAKMMTGGEAVMEDVLDYSCASVEYAGLVMYSYVKRGGRFALDPLEKVAFPVCSKVGAAYGWTLKGIQSGAGKISGLGRIAWPGGASKRLDAVEKRLAEIDSLKELLAKIDERLDYIERHGIVASREGGLEVKGKKLDESRLMVLRTIVAENIDLLSEN